MFKRILLALVFVTVSGSAVAQSSHSMIDRSRSSYYKNLFLTTSVEGEYGKISKSEKGSEVLNAESWRGYGIRNGLGIEMMKFTQFSLSHTLLNLRSAKSSAETLTGSRIAGEFALSFSAPLTNIQFGLGMVLSNLQYRSLDKNSAYSGTGHYYTVGLNHFFTPTISLQAVAKRIEGENRLSAGESDLTKFETATDNLSLGIAVWL
ncbi:MAG: hypothetical protein V4655_04900 [Bdellovibrionota bacterium]